MTETASLFGAVVPDDGSCPERSESESSLHSSSPERQVRRPPVTSTETDAHRRTTSDTTDDQGGKDNGTMYGAYLPSGGVLDGKKVWCADPGLDWPYADAYADGSDTKIKAPKLAYVFNEFDVPGSEIKNMARDIALASYLKQNGENRHRAILDVGSPESITNGIGWNEDSKNVKKVGKAERRGSAAGTEVLRGHGEGGEEHRRDYLATSKSISTRRPRPSRLTSAIERGKNVAGYDATVISPALSSTAPSTNCHDERRGAGAQDRREEGRRGQG